MAPNNGLCMTRNYFACLKDGNEEDNDATVCHSNQATDSTENGILHDVADTFSILAIPAPPAKVV